MNRSEVKIDEVKDIAERVAALVNRERAVSDLAMIRESLDSINKRLDALESTPVQLKQSHPSMDKFAIAEAIADSIFGAAEKEKACQFEPDKPCDHCSMCSSRGF